MTINLLVWCPVNLSGGGARLLIRLLRAFAVRNDIEKVRVAVPAKLLNILQTANANLPSIQYFTITTEEPSGTWQAWLRRDSLFLGIRGSGRIRKFFAKMFGLLPNNWLEYQATTASAGMDICYAFWAHSSPPIKIRTPIVCTMQDAIMLEYPEIAGWKICSEEWEWVTKWLGETIIVSSMSSDKTFSRLFGRDWPLATVIPHRILPDELGDGGQLPLGLPPRYLVYPANISPHKNHDNLFVAWAGLRAEERIPIVLFGTGTAWLAARQHPAWRDSATDQDGMKNNGARLSALAWRLGLRPGVDFFVFGYLPDEQVLGMVRNATALIMPSFAEGGGSYPVEEALTLGVPVLCSDIPVMREHLAERSARIAWFDPYSPDSIQEAYREMMSEYDDFKASAVRGMSDPRPTWDDIAAAYVDVFRQAIESGVRHA